MTETDIDETDLLIWDLAEIFLAYNISVMQALELIQERLPVAYVQLSESDPDTLH